MENKITKNFMKSTISSKSKQHQKQHQPVARKANCYQKQNKKENFHQEEKDELEEEWGRQEVETIQQKTDTIIQKSYIGQPTVSYIQPEDQPDENNLPAVEQVMTSTEVEKLKIRILCLEKIIKKLKQKNKKLQVIIKKEREKSSQADTESTSKLIFHPIDDLIGSGDVTTTYRGRYSGFGDVTIKRFKASMTSSDIVYAKAECEMLKGLRHENLMGIISFHCDATDSYVVMEASREGKSLKEILLEPENMDGMKISTKYLQITTTASQGINYLHQSTPQILHLNLKPSNIIVVDNNCSKVCDFAFSKFRNQTLASSHYVAPELKSHPIDISDKNDVFAFGMIMREMMLARLSISNFTHYNNDAIKSHPVQKSNKTSLLEENVKFLIELCLDEDYRKRPNFTEIIENLKQLSKLQSSILMKLSKFENLPARPSTTAATSSAKYQIPMTSSLPPTRDFVGRVHDDGVVVAKNELSAMRRSVRKEGEIQTEFASNMENIKQMFDQRFHGYLNEVDATCRNLTSQYDVITEKYASSKSALDLR